MKDYLLDSSLGVRATPQRQPDPTRTDQAPNSEGGYVFAVDKWTRLRRFLILGSEGGSYYANERKLTLENVGSVRDCIVVDGPRAVAEIVSISEGGRAPKNDPALYALAACISLGDRETKRAAAEALPRVARTGTHLYAFVGYAQTMRGWGRTLRWAVANWYKQNPAQLALQAVKYRQREGWTHRDLLRLSHPEAADPAVGRLYAWIAAGYPTAAAELDAVYGDDRLDWLVAGFARAQNAETPAETAAAVRDYKLPREAVKPEHLTDPVVWEALLDGGMPMTALIRNLATMTRVGVLKSRPNLAIATAALADQSRITKARVHPMALLVALRTYAAGYSYRGDATWTPIPDVVDALDAAFYLAFGNVDSTGKPHLLALDVSGSMAGGQVAGSPLTPREASVAMALVTLHAESDCHVVGFTGGMVPIGLSRRQRLDDAVRTVERLPFDRTDCAQPFLYAARENLDVASFVVYTDSETWAGGIHPHQALRRYREQLGVAARSAVVGMVSNGFSIADPTDAGMMDVVGFDTATPGLLAAFARGDL